MKFKDLCHSLGSNPLKCYLLVLASVVPLIPSLTANAQVDVQHLFEIATGVKAGRAPYSDMPFGYPPYILLILWPAFLSNDVEQFRAIFAIQILFADIWIKLLLIKGSSHSVFQFQKLFPFAAYTFVGYVFSNFYLQRFDAIVVLLLLLALLSLEHGPTRAGIHFGVACATKLFPLVCFLPIACALKREGLRRFLAGMAISAFPLIALAFFVPWWGFLTPHLNRSLQVESTYASILWVLKLNGLVDVRWVSQGAFVELVGPTITRLLPVSQSLCVAMTIVSIVQSLRLSLRTFSLDVLCCAISLPIAAFIVFNPVFSPQYLLWLAPFLPLSRGGRTATCLFLFGCALTRVFFPSPRFGIGLDHFESYALLIRNVLIFGVFVSLFRTSTSLTAVKLHGVKVDLGQRD